MASRRNLKKNIKFISIELVMECYVKYSFIPNVKETQVSEILLKINKLNYDLITRINHSDGKENNKVVKSYFKKLTEDWNKGVEEIVGDIEKLGK